MPTYAATDFLSLISSLGCFRISSDIFKSTSKLTYLEYLSCCSRDLSSKFMKKKQGRCWKSIFRSNLTLTQNTLPVSFINSTSASFYLSLIVVYYTFGFPGKNKRMPPLTRKRSFHTKRSLGSLIARHTKMKVASWSCGVTGSSPCRYRYGGSCLFASTLPVCYHPRFRKDPANLKHHPLRSFIRRVSPSQ